MFHPALTKRRLRGICVQIVMHPVSEAKGYQSRTRDVKSVRSPRLDLQPPMQHRVERGTRIHVLPPKLP